MMNPSIYGFYNFFNHPFRMVPSSYEHHSLSLSICGLVFFRSSLGMDLSTYGLIFFKSSFRMILSTCEPYNFQFTPWDEPVHLWTHYFWISSWDELVHKASYSYKKLVVDMVFKRCTYDHDISE